MYISLSLLVVVVLSLLVVLLLESLYSPAGASPVFAARAGIARAARSPDCCFIVQ